MGRRKFGQRAELGNHPAVGCVFPDTTLYCGWSDGDSISATDEGLDTRRVMPCYVKYVGIRRLLSLCLKYCQNRRAWRGSEEYSPIRKQHIEYWYPTQDSFSVLETTSPANRLTIEKTLRFCEAA